MMTHGLKVAGLFLGYGLIGVGGDYAAGLWAQDARLDGVHIDPVVAVEADIDRQVGVAVDVDVRRVSFDDRCAFEENRTASVAASADGRLRIDAGSGDLRVEGRAGLREVRVTARVCASHEEFMDDLRVALEQRGGEVSLETFYPDTDRNWRGNRTAQIHLTVEVPLNMAVDVDDSSGGIEVTGTGALRIDDSSGDIDVRGVNGGVWIDDSSGGIEVRDVSGDVEIEDGSGGIDVHDIRGSLRLRDGSGSIDVSEVDQDVVVDSDGSGSIRVQNVQGGFTVGRDGSGSIRYSGVAGAVDVPRDKKDRRRGN